ncbi:MAG: hypothetical protein LBN09_00585 [Clostridioides sp.]|jgi:NRPS condensation-like uncharacterized protein|nr:hypothetical protein [Clostridioides sp.]
MRNKKQYVITERAHFMCPNMYFGIKAKILAEFNYQDVRFTIEMLTKAHPFLKSLITEEGTTGKLFYNLDSELQIPIFEKNTRNSWDDDYKNITKNGWNIFRESLLKVIVYPEIEGFNIIFIAHHLLGDGRSILNLMCEFADCYSSRNVPKHVDEHLIQSVDDLPKGSDLSWISKIIVNKVNCDWQKENKIVGYSEYYNFEKDFIQKNPISFEIETAQDDKVEDLLNICRKRGISLNDYLVAEMMIKEKTNRVVIAVDIRDELICYSRGALGNYATAISVKNSFKTNNVIHKGRKVSKQIKKKLKNTRKKMLILTCYLQIDSKLIDAAAISTMGDFNSRTGKFLGSAILGYKKRRGYSVTNLGNTINPNIEEMVFIPPASPANIKTMGVVSVNNRLTKCTVTY